MGEISGHIQKASRDYAAFELKNGEKLRVNVNDDGVVTLAQWDEDTRQYVDLGAEGTEDKYSNILHPNAFRTEPMSDRTANFEAMDGAIRKAIIIHLGLNRNISYGRDQLNQLQEHATRRLDNYIPFELLGDDYSFGSRVKRELDRISPPTSIFEHLLIEKLRTPLNNALDEVRPDNMQGLPSFGVESTKMASNARSYDLIRHVDPFPEFLDDRDRVENLYRQAYEENSQATLDAAKHLVMDLAIFEGGPDAFKTPDNTEYTLRRVANHVLNNSIVGLRHDSDLDTFTFKIYKDVFEEFAQEHGFKMTLSDNGTLDFAPQNTASAPSTSPRP